MILPGILPFLRACWQRSVLVLLFALHGVFLRSNALSSLLLGLGRRFGKVLEAFTTEVLEHLPDDRSGKLEVKGQTLRVGEGLVDVSLVAEGILAPWRRSR